MNDLPDDQKPDNTVPIPSGSSLSKEKQEVVGGGLEAPALREVGKEGELPPEVTRAGVWMHPTTVPLPPAAKQLGVKQVGQVAHAAPAVALPISDDQIAAGLHQSITSSWRWLAEWCRRRLGQLHLALKKIHGKVLRVKTK